MNLYQLNIIIKTYYIYFRGFINLKYTLKDIFYLNKYNSKYINNLIISGASSGGLSLYINIDFIINYINNNINNKLINYGGIPDSGYFIKYESKQENLIIKILQIN